MSRRISNQCSRHWKLLESQIRGMQLTYRGLKLDHRSLCVVTDAIFLWLCCINDLREVIHAPLSLGEVGRWIKTNSQRPINEIVEDMKTADELVLQQIGDGFFDLSRFKHEYRIACHSTDTIGLCYPLLRDHSLSKEENLGIIHQAFSFMTRLTLKTDDPVMKEAAVSHFLECDNNLPTPPDDRPSRFFQRYLSQWKMTDEAIGYHSGGAVADCENSLSAKYRHLGQDAMTRYLDLRIGTDIPFDRPALIRTAKLVCVPKNVSKFRTISMEPCALQYYQHGIGYSLEKYIHSHKYLMRRINLRDADINRRYAQSASFMGRWATIDLTDASDSVSLAQVRQWIPNQLQQALILCRSKEVLLPDGSLHTLNKYAGMGSRLTFLLECLIFCSLIELAIEEDGMDPVKSGYRVYGDDILIETEHVSTLVDVFNRYGYRINTTKSYYNTSGDFIFRESCGGEFVNGVDITPIRLPRNFRGLTTGDTRRLWQSAATELANRCYQRLPSVRSHIIHCLLAMKDSQLPIFSDSALGVYSPQASNYHLRHRYNDRYQCQELVHGDTKVPHVSNDRDDDVAYIEWLRLSRSRQRLLYPDDRIDVETNAIPPVRWLTTTTLW